MGRKILVAAWDVNKYCMYILGKLAGREPRVLSVVI
jgi:hypothetical protein